MHALGFGTGFRLNRRGGTTTVAFDFTAGALPAGASLTRASAGTRVDAASALAGETSDVARFDYDPATLALKGLLVEGAATNVASNSQDWTQPSWTAAKLTPAVGALVETSGSGIKTVFPTAVSRSLTSGVPVVMSAIAAERAGSAKRWLGMSLGAAGFAAQPFAAFDLATGVVTLATGGSAGCAAAPGGWLCWLSAMPNVTTTSAYERYFVSNSGTSANPGYTGDGASGIAVSEAQFEAGSVPTSRIRTGASAASRAADALTLDWGAKGVADGPVVLRVTFDDGSFQDLAATVSGGLAAVPAGLNRPWVRRVEKM